MERYITYRRMNNILLEIKKLWSYHNDCQILEIEIQELITLWFMNLEKNNLIIWDITNCYVTKEWEKFLKIYSWYRKIEYFFKDYPFLGSLLMWFIWWIWVLFIKNIISGWCNL